ncbi:unnamed protein product [Cyprideis torosa]|uniref:Uncharacterized protein n=1 Tax=Cyprideis torosa TaxID=163714 RepID=A0A7R8WNW3_9CRUS|nr:unnamed protein product [Cyprideis torosa]CAG0906685.1 unnamed protein product [Cyprideis torosa]
MADVSRANSKPDTKSKSKQKEDVDPIEKAANKGCPAEKKCATSDKKEGKKAEDKEYDLTRCSDLTRCRKTK